MQTTVGRLLLDQALPEKHRKPDAVFTKGHVESIFQDIAENDPEQYSEIATKLMQLGNDTIQSDGGSIKLSELRTAKIKKQLIGELQTKIRRILQNTKLSPEQRNKAIVDEADRLTPILGPAVLEEGLAENNRLSHYARSGARGSPSAVNQIRGAPLLVTDQNGDIIPVPIMHSYSEGLDPAEMFAASYGVRKGYIQIKSCLAQGTLVRMSDGDEKAIEDIQPGDWVLGYNRVSNETEPVLVLERFDNGKKPVFRYVFEIHDPAGTRGCALEGTIDHKILVYGDSVTTTTLQRLDDAYPLIRVFDEPPMPCTAPGLPPYEYYGRVYVDLVPTYDLHVDHPSHLYVLANGLVVSNSTPKAGYFGKQLANAAHRLVVTGDRPRAGTGYPVSVADNDNVGAVLAQDVGPYKEGTILSGKILKSIQNEYGKEKILVHSPISAIGSGDGLPQWAVGVRESRRLADIGSNVGATAAQAVSEPLSQAMISAKHVAGVRGHTGGGSSANMQQGFDVVNRFTNIPGTFLEHAPVAEADGIVDRIEKAPQGGFFVTVSGHRHHVMPGQAVTVKKGDTVTAGDPLSDGLPNPADVVRHKGVGEGRKYFAEKFLDILRNSGVKTHRRNVEVLSRAIVNHVRLDADADPADLPDGMLPDDVVSYDALAAQYKPRKEATSTPLAQSAGRYLEQPVLHYSIGTRVTPAVQKTLKEFNVENVVSHEKAPYFQPEMQRLLSNMEADQDWMTRLGGFNLGKQLLDSTHRSLTSDVHSTSYIPALANATTFGKGQNGKY